MPPCASSYFVFGGTILVIKGFNSSTLLNAMVVMRFQKYFLIFLYEFFYDVNEY